MQLSQRLREARHRIGVAASVMSERAGLSPAVVGQIERGESASPRLSTLRKICAYLQCDLGWLVDGEGRPPRRACPESEAA